MKLSKISQIAIYSILMSKIVFATTNKVPVLIDAKLTSPAIEQLKNSIGDPLYSIDYLKNSDGGHSTITYGATSQEYDKLKPNLTNTFKVEVNEYCWSDSFQVEAALATVYNENNTEVIGNDPFQHVTLSFANNRHAVDSNYLFECSSSEYANYPYCQQNNLHITDLKCKTLDKTLILDAVLEEK